MQELQALAREEEGGKLQGAVEYAVRDSTSAEGAPLPLDLLRAMGQKAMPSVEHLTELPSHVVDSVRTMTGITPRDIVLISSIFKSNAYAVYGREHQSIGRVFYCLLGFADHSCDPNECLDRGTTRTAIVRSRQKISPGDPITMTYLDPDYLDRTACTRRKRLFQLYGALCHCEQCERCLACDKGAKELDRPLQRCRRCHNGLYCDKPCQNSHWARHKKECSSVKC